jgi:hypothetical protein
LGFLGTDFPALMKCKLHLTLHFRTASVWRKLCFHGLKANSSLLNFL